MSNFGKNLVKGFIRSAVNQVGRDTGKVVSNQVFGNAHSRPVRSVPSNLSSSNFLVDSSTQAKILEIEDIPELTRDECIQYNLTKQPLMSSFYKILLYISIMIPIIGWFSWFCFSLAQMLDTKVYYSGIHTGRALVSDRRYKEGYKEMEISHQVTYTFPYRKSDWKEILTIILSSLVFGLIFNLLLWLTFYKD